MSMTAVHVIRPALPEDFEAVKQLRQGYCQHAYKGFDVLCNLKDDQEFAELYQKWLSNPSIRVVLLYLDDVLTAFCTYCLSPSSCGEIMELQYQPDAHLASLEHLVKYVIKDLEDSGARYVDIWILKDNLRTRFHYQHFGFKPIGGSREVKFGESSLSATRYVYCLTECPPDTL